MSDLRILILPSFNNILTLESTGLMCTLPMLLSFGISKGLQPFPEISKNPRTHEAYKFICVCYKVNN